MDADKNSGNEAQRSQPPHLVENQAATEAVDGVAGLAFSHDEALIAEAVREARRIQEFIWGAESRSQLPFDAEAWRVIFQKRVDAISNLDLSQPAALVELRKRLLQQAALSIKAMVALRQHGLAARNGQLAATASAHQLNK